MRMGRFSDALLHLEIARHQLVHNGIRNYATLFLFHIIYKPCVTMGISRVQSWWWGEDGRITFPSESNLARKISRKEGNSKIPTLSVLIELLWLIKRRIIVRLSALNFSSTGPTFLGFFYPP